MYTVLPDGGISYSSHELVLPKLQVKPGLRTFNFTGIKRNGSVAVLHAVVNKPHSKRYDPSSEANRETANQEASFLL
jgi:hypothetical protein